MCININIKKRWTKGYEHVVIIEQPIYPQFTSLL